MANIYTCELCGQRRRDYAVVHTPFYFEVLDGPDDDAWGKHSNEAKYCDEHVDEYEWPVSTSDLSLFQRIDRSPRTQCEQAVIAKCEERRVPEGVEVDYYFAPKGTVA